MKLTEETYVNLTEETYVNRAEKVINKLSRSKKIVGGREKPIKLITTSKIRNLLAIMMDIKNDILESGTETLTPELAGRIQYLKVRMIYEAGRDESVNEFLRISQLIDHVDKNGTSRKNYLLITRYMEALVAFRKFRGDDE